MEIIRQKVIKELEKKGMNIHYIKPSNGTVMPIYFCYSSPTNNAVRTSDGYIELQRIKIKILEPEYKYDPGRILLPASWLRKYDILAFVYKSKIVIIKSDDIYNSQRKITVNRNIRYIVNLCESGYKEDC